MHFPLRLLFVRNRWATTIALLVLLPFVSAARGETLALDAKGSAVTFTCSATFHGFHGEAKDVTGQAEYTANAIPPIQKAILHFKTVDITTFHKERDQKMLEWLNVKVHPEATFRLEKVELLAGDYKTTGPAPAARFAITGIFIFNDVPQMLTGTAKGWRDKDRVVIAGDTVVDTSKYGLPQIRQVAILTVDTEVKTAFRVSFVLPPEMSEK